MFKKRPSKPETARFRDVVSRESKKFYRLYKSHVLSKITLTIIGIGFTGFSGWSMYRINRKTVKGQTISRGYPRIHGEMGTGSPTQATVSYCRFT